MSGLGLAVVSRDTSQDARDSALVRAAYTWLGLLCIGSLTQMAELGPVLPVLALLLPLVLSILSPNRSPVDYMINTQIIAR